MEESVNKQRKWILIVSLIFVVLMSLSGIAWAQDATPEASPETGESAPTTDFNLVYNVPANGEISNREFSQTWTLRTASADRLSIRVERTSGNLIPDVAILDANNQQIQASYGPDRTGAVAEIENFTLPAGGEYQVLVQRRDAGTGLTAGEYTLTVIPLATAEDNPNNQFVNGPVEADTPISGEITPAHWYQRYIYTAEGPDVIWVRVDRMGGSLLPEVEVLDVNGTALQTGYTENTGDWAEIRRLELPSAGEYTVAVTRQSRFTGESVGTFEMMVVLMGAGEGSPLLAPAAGNEVVYDTPLKGTINARWYEDWTLTTDAGDTITLTVTSDAATSNVEGNLQPEVILLGGSGQELTHGYTSRDGASARVERYQLDGPGTYTVRVSRAQGITGLTYGPYTLVVSLDGSGLGTLAEPVGEVELGTPVDGQITNLLWAEIWTFTGEEDQVIDIIVERTEGTLIPLVEILDANGQSLRSTYYEPTWDRVILDRYTLPSDGEYRIRVYRDGEQNGYTSGEYSLLVREHSDE
jgi:hypothetical protein